MGSIITPEQYAAYARAAGLEPAPAGLEDAIEKSSADALRIAGREFVPSPASADATETRTFRGTGNLTLYIDDCLAVSSVAIDGVGITDYRAIAVERPLPILALERSGSIDGDGLPRVSSSAPQYRWPAGSVVTVTGRFGYAEQAELPADLVEAIAALTALRLVAGPSLWQQATEGSSRITVLNVTIDDKPTAGSALDTIRKDAERVLRGYRRIM